MPSKRCLICNLRALYEYAGYSAYFADMYCPHKEYVRYPIFIVSYFKIVLTIFFASFFIVSGIAEIYNRPIAEESVFVWIHTSEEAGAILSTISLIINLRKCQSKINELNMMLYIYDRVKAGQLCWKIRNRRFNIWNCIHWIAYSYVFLSVCVEIMSWFLIIRLDDYFSILGALNRYGLAFLQMPYYGILILETNLYYLFIRKCCDHTKKLLQKKLQKVNGRFLDEEFLKRIRSLHKWYWCINESFQRNAGMNKLTSVQLPLLYFFWTFSFVFVSFVAIIGNVQPGVNDCISICRRIIILVINGSYLICCDYLRDVVCSSFIPH